MMRFTSIALLLSAVALGSAKPTEETSSESPESCWKKYPYFMDKDGILCYLLRQKILDEDYNVDLTKIPGYIKGFNQHHDALLDECVVKSAVKKESLKETAYHLQVCIMKAHQDALNKAHNSDAAEICWKKYPGTWDPGYVNKDFTLCYFLRKKILDEDYNVDLTKMNGYIKGFDPKYDALVDECAAKSALKKESLKETAYHLDQCIKKAGQDTSKYENPRPIID